MNLKTPAFHVFTSQTGRVNLSLYLRVCVRACARVVCVVCQRGGMEGGGGGGGGEGGLESIWCGRMLPFCPMKVINVLQNN